MGTSRGSLKMYRHTREKLSPSQFGDRPLNFWQRSSFSRSQPPFKGFEPRTLTQGFAAPGSSRKGAGWARHSSPAPRILGHQLHGRPWLAAASQSRSTHRMRVDDDQGDESTKPAGSPGRRRGQRGPGTGAVARAKESGPAPPAIGGAGGSCFGGPRGQPDYT